MGEVRRASALAAAIAAALLGGCDRDDPEVPVACKEGPASVRAALDSAPREVRLGDGTRLSACLVDRSDAADMQAVGGGFVEAASQLAPAARAEPEGPAALRLGYLVGAARRGAGGTGGIHYDLVKRLEQEASAVEGRSRAFGEGVAAGRRSG